MDQERTLVSPTARGNAARSKGMIETGAGARPAARARALAVLTFIASIAALTLAGCGKSQDEGKVTGTVASQADFAGPPAELASPVPVPAGGESGVAVTRDAAVPADSLAPDLVVSMSDTIGVQGRSVELVARTSLDVAGVTLWDGLGQKQAFAYDSTAALWRTSYRVPLGASRERLGLAVTAGNHAGKWRRVWVFLKTTPEASRAGLAPPPGS